MKSILRTIKKALLVLGCAALVIGLMTNANVVRAEEEQPTQQQESSDPAEITNTTNEDNQNDWSDFFNNEENRQTSEDLDNSKDLTEEQQNQSNTAVGAVSQDKTAYSPEETQDEEEDNPIIYEYKIVKKDCDGNVVSEEVVQSEQPHDDVIIEATGCTIPTNPKPRPVDDLPPTSTTNETVVYDSTPAASIFVVMALFAVVGGIAFCFAKPSMAKKAVKEQI